MLLFLRRFGFGRFRRFRRRSVDHFLLIVVGLIILFGLLMLASASSNLGQREFNDSLYFLKNQAIKGLALGGLFFFILYYIDPKYLKKLSVPLLLINIILLILVFSPLGETQKGAARWLNFGFFSLQPSELVKLTFILYLASWLSKNTAQRAKSFFAGFIPFLIISGLISFLLSQQPATSIVAIIMLSAIIVYFASGGKLSFIAGLLMLGFLSTAILIAITPYRMERINSFLNFYNKTGDIKGSAYHIDQAIIAIGSGGLFGVGYGESIHKIKLLPEPIGDSIFAVVAEEFGFIGSASLTILFLLVVLRAFIISSRLNDNFARLTVIGFASIIGIQTFVHIGANSGLIPLTGVPLPFISYGSTATVVFISMTAIILNLSRQATS